MIPTHVTTHPTAFRTQDDAEGRYPKRFYSSTIIGRLLLSAAFCGLVLAGECEGGLLWLAAANAMSSLLLQRAVWRRAHENHSSCSGR